MIDGSRMVIVPVAWWALFGFRGESGVELLQDRLGVGPVGAAALTALVLAVLSTVALLPYPRGRAKQMTIDQPS
jgi:hypothetical protein